jgi:stage II sporulation protein D
MSSSRPFLRCPLFLVLLAGLTAALVVVPADSGRAATTAHPVPTDRVFDVVGKGFGHGHGMSQYGAKSRGAAGHALSAIMAAYYPGTTMNEVADTSIDVILTNSGVEGLPAGSAYRYQADYSRTGAANAGIKIVPQAGLKFRRLGGRDWATLPASVGGQRVLLWGAGPVSATHVRMHARTALGWSPFGPADMGGFALARDTAPTRLLYLSGAEVDYLGRIEVRRTGPTRIARVNVVSMEAYLRGVVPREMPASWPARALQAQAVAARTYAAWDRDHPKRWYHTCDSTYCQVYRGLRAKSRSGAVTAADPRSDAAIAASGRLVMIHQGRPAFTQFSASNGGWKSAGSTAYLAAGRDSYDAFPAWQDTLSARTLERAYPSLGTLDRIVILSREGGGAAWGGRVVRARLEGHKSGATRTVTVTGETLRRLGGFKSSLFTFS